MIRFTDLSLHWPEVVRFRERVAKSFHPRERVDCVVILPCSKRKPYSSSKSHRLFDEVIRPARRKANVREIIITSPLGAVPRELEDLPPARNYDIPVTGAWSEEEIEITSQSLSTVLGSCAHKGTRVVAHVHGGYLESCRRAEAILGSGFYYTGTERPASSEGLKSLSQALRGLEGRPGGVGRVERSRLVLSYQYGIEAADAMTHPPIKVRMTRGTECIMRDEGIVARRNPYTGLYIPGDEGMEALSANNRYCVDIDFKPEAKVIYCPGVVWADAAIRPDDEVVVRWKGCIVGQGRSVLNGSEMVGSDRGKAVALRTLL